MLPHSLPQRCSRGLWCKDWGAGSLTAPGPTLGIPVSRLRGLGPAHQRPRRPVFSSRGRSRRTVSAVVSANVRCPRTLCPTPSSGGPSPGHTFCFLHVPGHADVFGLCRRARCGEPRRMERWLHLPVRSQGQRRPRLGPRFLPTWRCPVHTWRRPCLASAETWGWAAPSISSGVWRGHRHPSCQPPPLGQGRATFTALGQKQGGLIVELGRENYNFLTELKIHKLNLICD